MVATLGRTVTDTFYIHTAGSVNNIQLYIIVRLWVWVGAWVKNIVQDGHSLSGRTSSFHTSLVSLSMQYQDPCALLIGA